MINTDGFGICFHKLENGRYEWSIPFPSKRSSLHGWFTYRSKASAKRAAKIAIRKLFGTGDMV